MRKREEGRREREEKEEKEYVLSGAKQNKQGKR